VGLSAGARVDGVEKLLDWLPDQEDPAYAAMFAPPRKREGERRRNPVMFSFLQANLYRALGEDWYEKWKGMIVGQLKQYGMNTLGNWSDERLFGVTDIPYVTSLPDFPDTEKKIFDLLQSRSSGDFVPIRQVVLNVLENIERASKTKDTVTGVPTGFIDLDYKTSGFQPSDFILIAARPSMGKTAFVLNVVDHVTVRRGTPCMVFSLEMSKEQLVNRMLSMESNVDSQKLRTGTLTDSDWDAVVEGVGVIGSSKLIIDDTPGISITELRSKCRKAKLEHDIGIVIIDYLQLMTGSGGRGSDNRQQEISEISRSLKALARELQAPVVALSQLSRAC